MFTRILLCLLLPLTLFAGTLATEQERKPMTNADIISLVNAGIGDDIIIAKIQGAPATDFDTGVEGLKALQAAHVSTSIIRAMVASHPASPAAEAASNASGNPSDVHSPGIYLYAVSSAGHTLTELQRVSPKQTKGSGALLSGITYGIKKFKVRGVLDGAHAPVRTADPNPVFYLYSPAYPGTFGGSYIKPNDFTLIKLTEKDNTREILEGSGSIWGTTMGTDDRAKRGFGVDEIKPGIYKLTLVHALAPGEYAFQQNAGMLFDFRILPPE